MTASDDVANIPISIHALCEEGDFESLRAFMNENIFLSTPSARRATHRGLAVQAWHIISIHALCEEGDDAASDRIGAGFVFLSTPSARRATIPPGRGIRG